MERNSEAVLMNVEPVSKAIVAGMPPEMVSEVIALCDTAWQVVKKTVQLVSQCVSAESQ